MHTQALSQAPQAPRPDVSQEGAPRVRHQDIWAGRCTLYPTATAFRDDFPAEQLVTAWEARRDTGEPLALYVHLPFCADICHYCACNRIITRKRELVRRYLTALAREVRMLAPLAGRRRPVTRLHWGGGTPTFLNPAELTELMYLLASNFCLLDGQQREYAIEIDPRTLTTDTLALLKGLGFNRVSFGIQDFDPAVQRAINRVQPFAMIAELCESVRTFGFRSLAMDLICGLPLQSVDSFRATLEQVIALSPGRIALHDYAHSPEQFPAQRALGHLPRPDASTRLAMFAEAAALLCAAGYRQIGMDHFALATDDLGRAQEEGQLQRNFQGDSASLASDTLGLGISARSSVGDICAANHEGLAEYYRALDQGLPTARGLVLSTGDRLRRELIMRLLCDLEADLAAIGEPYRMDAWRYFSAERARLAPMLEAGLLQFRGQRLLVTPRGRPLLRQICMTFDAHRGQCPTGASSKVL